MKILEPSTHASANYGVGDNSFQAAGGEPELRRLVDAFYDAMAAEHTAANIRAMHSEDLTESRDKLARFLCGWLGGPKRYSEKYGAIAIPAAHRHLNIGIAERDAWLHCMAVALAQQPYDDEFKTCLLQQLYVPAERSRNRE